MALTQIFTDAHIIQHMCVRTRSGALCRRKRALLRSDVTSPGCADTSALSDQSLSFAGVAAETAPLRTEKKSHIATRIKGAQPVVQQLRWSSLRSGTQWLQLTSRLLADRSTRHGWLSFSLESRSTYGRTHTAGPGPARADLGTNGACFLVRLTPVSSAKNVLERSAPYRRALPAGHHAEGPGLLHDGSGPGAERTDLNACASQAPVMHPHQTGINHASRLPGGDRKRSQWK
jgi:hypothetical protein